jgi:hypothetical protein
MIKALSQALGLGVAVAAMVEPVHADAELPCWPYCDIQAEYNQVCVDNFGPGSYYCGDAGPDYIWCCNT